VSDPRNTHAERLAALEAERPFNRSAMDALMKRLDLMEQHMSERLDKIDARLTTQETKLAAYENKGKGMLLGVGLFGAGVGAGLLAAIERIAEFFNA
jgi:hypothetical protein